MSEVHYYGLNFEYEDGTPAQNIIKVSPAPLTSYSRKRIVARLAKTYGVKRKRIDRALYLMLNDDGDPAKFEDLYTAQAKPSDDDFKAALIQRILEMEDEDDEVNEATTETVGETTGS